MQDYFHIASVASIRRFDFVTWLHRLIVLKLGLIENGDFISTVVINRTVHDSEILIFRSHLEIFSRLLRYNTINFVPKYGHGHA